MKHLNLGASIYVPATRSDMIHVSNGEKFACRSVIFCTEDSVNEQDLPKALNNLQDMLNKTHKNDKLLKFIRVRNEKVLKQVLEMQDIDKIDGFVLPKITKESFNLYMAELNKVKNNFYLMPTLETKDVFETVKMQELCNMFLEEKIKDRILSLRIGGNDLLNLLGIRRSRYRTIYESPLGATISNLVTIFKPNGFNLTAPVCESIQDNELLGKEIPQDLEYGLFGKTAIHPDQIKFIELFYTVNEQDLEMAQAILHKDAPAVFGMHGTMCEKATHSNWAKETIERAKIYGVYGILNNIAK